VANGGLGKAISIGGALGLQHYLDYRPTHDVDAWWASAAGPDERAEVVHVVEEALAGDGEVRTRRWGEVVSVELRVVGKKVFSFQIAERSAQLEPTTVLPWADVALDSLPDLIASKMVALVERGAPRDFLDVYTLCQAGLTTAAECWRLWRERQRRAGSDADPRRARLAVETQLARIALHRPLESIADAEERAASERVRAWVEEELLDALVD
jgi:hypothetical protein